MNSQEYYIQYFQGERRTGGKDRTEVLTSLLITRLDKPMPKKAERMCKSHFPSTMLKREMGRETLLCVPCVFAPPSISDTCRNQGSDCSMVSI